MQREQRCQALPGATVAGPVRLPAALADQEECQDIGKDAADKTSECLYLTGLNIYPAVYILQFYVYIPLYICVCETVSKSCANALARWVSTPTS